MCEYRYVARHGMRIAVLAPSGRVSQAPSSAITGEGAKVLRQVPLAPTGVRGRDCTNLGVDVAARDEQTALRHGKDRRRCAGDHVAPRHAAEGPWGPTNAHNAYARAAHFGHCGDPQLFGVDVVDMRDPVWRAWPRCRLPICACASWTGIHISSCMTMRKVVMNGMARKSLSLDCSQFMQLRRCCSRMSSPLPSSSRGGCGPPWTTCAPRQSIAPEAVGFGRLPPLTHESLRRVLIIPPPVQL